MEEINIWDLGNKIYIKPNRDFLLKINSLITKNFKSKEKFYNKIKKDLILPYTSFKSRLKYSYYNKFYGPLDVFVVCCDNLGISRIELQNNIESYKTKNGYNIIENPILPIKITPLFDMILAHNMADGTVINCGGRRQVYFGYRQYDKELRKLYLKKIESIFGKIKFKKDYFDKRTMLYCPVVVSQLFFRYYKLNKKSFLSEEARIPKEILDKNKEYLLAVLLAFIIDEGSVDSTLINIRLKNLKLLEDLYKICKKLGYGSTLNINKYYGSLYIKRDGMKKLFGDYKELIKKYPEASLGKKSKKIEDGFKIYDRTIYKSKGNKRLILNMLKLEDLTVNQMANKINMTRQGVRFHIHKLEGMKKITRNGFVGKGKNILYGFLK